MRMTLLKILLATLLSAGGRRRAFRAALVWVLGRWSVGYTRPNFTGNLAAEAWLRRR